MLITLTKQQWREVLRQHMESLFIVELNDITAACTKVPEVEPRFTEELNPITAVCTDVPEDEPVPVEIDPLSAFGLGLIDWTEAEFQIHLEELFRWKPNSIC